MGMGKWFLFVTLVSVPLLGFGMMADATSGPYNVTCQNASSGFQITLMSVRTGETQTVSSPFGVCPPN
jgi:hypothetical protein